MVMHDYHKEGTKIVLLLHPMLASGEMMYDLLGKHLGDDVRCLAPDFASHGAERDREFPGAAAEADKIADYLKENGITHIDLAYGASLGGVVLTQLMKKGLRFTTAFFEGTSFFEGAWLLTKIISAVFIKKHRRAAASYERSVEVMSGLYGEKYGEKFADQFIGMSESSIRKIAESCGNNEHASLSPAAQRRCIFTYGSKDMNVSRAKKGHKKFYPNARFILWDGFGHCEKVTADTDAYIGILRDCLGGTR